MDLGSLRGEGGKGDKANSAEDVIALDT